METRLKPEVEKILEVFRRNRDYLINSGIYEEKNSFQKDLEHFYDLEWVKKTGVYFKFSYHYTELERSQESRDKFGKIPKKLIEILDDVRSELGKKKVIKGNVDICELSYEKIRESFDRPIFPLWRRILNASLNLTGMAATIGGVFYSANNLMNDNLSGLVYSIPLMVGGLSLALFYSPQKNWKEWETFIDINTSQENKKRNKAFWELHFTASETDSFIETYKQVFDF